MKVITPHQILPSAKAFCDTAKQITACSTDNSARLTNSLNQLSFLGKTSVIKKITKPEFLKKHAELLTDDCKYTKNIKEFVSELKDGSRELEDIDTLLECFDTRKYEPKFGEPSFSVRPHADNLFKSLQKGRVLPKGLSEDLALLRKGGSVLDNYIPILSSRKEALETKKVGDLFQIGNKDRVCILNRKGEIEELNMTRESCIRLFPPVERMCNIQPKEFGNCYEETALNALMSTPETRENILRCIDTVSDKHNTIVTFPNGYIKDGIKINEGEIYINQGKEYYTQGCMGMQLIQHALGIEYEKEFVEFELKKLRMQGKDSSVRTVAHLYQNGRSEQLANFFNGRYYGKSLGTNLRSGGTAIVPWYKMGLTKVGESNLLKEKYTTVAEKEKAYKYKHETDNREYLEHYFGDKQTEDLDSYCERIESPEFFKTHLVQAVIHDGNPETQFMADHSYKLDAKINDAGEIEHYLLKNPHDLTETVLSYDDVIEQLDHIFYSKIG